MKSNWVTWGFISLQGSSWSHTLRAAVAGHVSTEADDDDAAQCKQLAELQVE